MIIEVTIKKDDGTVVHESRSWATCATEQTFNTPIEDGGVMLAGFRLIPFYKTEDESPTYGNHRNPYTRKYW